MKDILCHVDGTKTWIKNGQYHRTDGPAIEFFGGYKSWHINGIPFDYGDYKESQKNYKAILLLTAFMKVMK